MGGGPFAKSVLQDSNSFVSELRSERGTIEPKYLLLTIPLSSCIFCIDISDITLNSS